MVNGAGREKTAHNMVSSWNELVEIILSLKLNFLSCKQRFWTVFASYGLNSIQILTNCILSLKNIDRFNES
jgi:hypothetical protein